MTARGFRSPVCWRGHPFTEANTYWTAGGGRRCRRCASELRKAARAAEHPPVSLALRPPAWMDDALCAQADPEAWFPDKGEKAELAKRVCASCPVRAECLDHALALGELHGVWGGLTEHERRPLRRERRTAA